MNPWGIFTLLSYIFSAGSHGVTSGGLLSFYGVWRSDTVCKPENESRITYCIIKRVQYLTKDFFIQAFQSWMRSSSSSSAYRMSTRLL